MFSGLKVRRGVVVMGHSVFICVFGGFTGHNFAQIFNKLRRNIAFATSLYRKGLNKSVERKGFFSAFSLFFACEFSCTGYIIKLMEVLFFLEI